MRVFEGAFIIVSVVFDHIASSSAIDRCTGVKVFKPSSPRKRHGRRVEPLSVRSGRSRGIPGFSKLDRRNPWGLGWPRTATSPT
jgi:hypothetical protein